MSGRPKKAAKIVGALLIVLFAVLIFNALRMRAAVLAAPPTPPADSVDANVVAQHLSWAVRFKTVSHEDPKEDDASALNDLRAWLEATYPKVHAALSREIVGEHSMLYT